MSDKTIRPADSRSAKRARFSSEGPRGSQASQGSQVSPLSEDEGTSPGSSEAGRRGGASPFVLAGGLLIVAAIVGILIATAGGPSRSTSPQVSAGQFANAELDTSGKQAPAGASTAGVQTGSAQSSAGQSASAVKAATLGHDPYPLVSAEDGAVRLPLSTFDDYKAHFYTYLVNGKPIEFFVVKSGDGTVRAAFNACDVCYPAKRGYLQQGDEMVCQNCGSRFPTDKINIVRGGCNPSPLTRTVVGDTLIILDSDLAAGAQYF